jgi:hemoglobin
MILSVESVPEQQVYARIGEAGFARLTAAFYRRVASDPILSAMYPHDDLPAAEARLRGFLIYRFGGPTDYIHERGHPRLRMRHAPFKIDQTARDRWVSLMNAALHEAEIDRPAAETLREFFAQTATFLINREAQP